MQIQPAAVQATVKALCLAFAFSAPDGICLAGQSGMSFRVTAQMAAAPPGGGDVDGGTAACRSNGPAAAVQCLGTLPLVKPLPGAAGLVVTGRYSIASDIIGKPSASLPDPGPSAVDDSAAATRVANWGGREYLEVTVSW